MVGFKNLFCFFCRRLKKLEHNYTNDVKKQISATKQAGTARVRQSAMTAIFDETERRFNFEDDHLMGKNARELVTTGNRMHMTQCSAVSSSTIEKGQKANVYKFKNIHGDRGTYAGISAGDHNGPPSSIWKDHPIPKHLLDGPKGI